MVSEATSDCKTIVTVKLLGVFKDRAAASRCGANQIFSQ